MSAFGTSVVAPEGTIGPLHPRWECLHASDAKWVGETVIGHDLAVLNGHFPEEPIVPGIAQLYWAATLARLAFSQDAGMPTGEVHGLKFKRVIRPGARLRVSLALSARDGSPRHVAFDYRSTCLHGHGRLLLEGANTRGMVGCVPARLAAKNVTTSTSGSEIEFVLPHASPMILIASANSQSDSATRSTVHIREDSMFFEPPYGVPAYVGLEYIAQTIAAHGGIRARASGDPVRIGFLLGTRRYDCQTAYFPLGSWLVCDVELIYESSNLCKFDGVIKDAHERELARCAMTVYQRTGTPGEP